MKKIITAAVLGLSLFGFLGFSVSHADAATRVHGYTTKRGTYVAPHYRSTSNSRKSDNYSSRGNYNPYTGKKGYKSF
jgi:hypothetical protein